MWVMMHAEQIYLNRDYSILEQKGRCMPLYHILSWFTIVCFCHDVWFWHVFAEFWHRLHWLKTPDLMPSRLKSYVHTHILSVRHRNSSWQQNFGKMLWPMQFYFHLHTGEYKCCTCTKKNCKIGKGNLYSTEN